jgi:dolichol-phosphate mannosyltransferase
MMDRSPNGRRGIAVVIPAYNVANSIAAVLAAIPPIVSHVLVVDDASTDGTAAVVGDAARSDARIELVRHEHRRGVGGAMVTGFRRALQLPAAIVVKVDGDGQMPLAFLPRLIAPLVAGTADYVKGNRFRDLEAIRRMPPLRRFGNVVLSFLAKAATGYWNCFDPTNGYVAIRAEVLARLPLQKIDRGYFFEISMLSYLYLEGAVVRDEPIPARYEGEPSHMSLPRVMAAFPGRLLASLARRIALHYFLYDFSLASLQFAAGLPLLAGGALYGGYKWYWYASHHLPAPTGTVVLPALMIILGLQLLLSAMALDLGAVPREPINDGPLVQAPDA